MPSLYDRFETNGDLERNGITLDFGEYGKFIVARAGGANMAFARVREAKLRPFRRQIQLDALPHDQWRKLLVEIFVESCMIGWEGIEGRDGKPLQFTAANAVKLFVDLPELFEQVYEHASKADNFQANLENDAG